NLCDIASGGGSEGDGDVGRGNGGGQRFRARDLGYGGWRGAMIGAMGAGAGAGAVAGGAGGPGAGGVGGRPWLVGRLGAQARVSVVSAPAGSGKAVLLRWWISRSGLAERVAWVPAGRGERDPQRFWLAVLAALRATAAGSALVRAVTAAPDLGGWGITERLVAGLGPPGGRGWVGGGGGRGRGARAAAAGGGGVLAARAGAAVR